MVTDTKWKKLPPKHRHRRPALFDVVNYTFLGLLCLAMLYPFVYIIAVSLTDANYVTEVTVLPIKLTFQYYEYIFNLSSVRGGYLNTVLYTFLYTLISMVLTTLCAYPLSKRWLPGRGVFTAIILFTMFFGGGLIPTYLLVDSLHLTNSMWALILPSCMSTWNMIIMRTFFQSSVPRELEEAAFIDGAGEFRILWSVYLPLSKPIIATLSLFYAVAKWNSWFDASIYLTDEAKYPIQLILRNIMVSPGGSGFNANDIANVLNIVGPQDLNYTSMNYALTVAIILPIMLLYPFLQKYFIKGVMVGSLKG